jgi:hypothetical protein
MGSEGKGREVGRQKYVIIGRRNSEILAQIHDYYNCVKHIHLQLLLLFKSIQYFSELFRTYRCLLLYYFRSVF